MSQHQNSLFRFEQMNPPVTAVEIGDPEAWIKLYEEQTKRDDELMASMTVTNEVMDNLKNLSTRISIESQFSHENGNLESVSKLVHEGEDIMELFKLAQSNAINAHQKVSEIYGEVGFKEWELGEKLESIPPASYITRAIGPPKPVINKRYRQVRAEIEIFRQLTGLIDPNITLGKGSPMAWSRNRLAGFVMNIQRIQVAQIQLANDPNAIAKSFGKELIIERLGVPPKIVPEEEGRILELVPDGSWHSAAILMCKEIEPYEGGLLIDH